MLLAISTSYLSSRDDQGQHQQVHESDQDGLICKLMLYQGESARHTMPGA